MTEAEWLACTDPDQMLQFIWGKTSHRKLRLFVVACCRRAWHLIEPHPAIVACVEQAEGYADGLGTRDRLRKSVEENCYQFWHYGDRPGEDVAVAHVANAARATCERMPLINMATVRKQVGYALDGVPTADHPGQAATLRCVFGNPFRPVAADPRWLTSIVNGLASAIYAEWAFDPMPILADALQDAGCEDEAVLSHCRGEGPPRPGVLDLMLGKA